MSNDLGFLIAKLTNAPIHDTILKTIKEYINNRPYNQHVIFNSFNDKVELYNIPILHLSHSKFFYGDLVVFDFMSLVLASKFPNIKNLYYYAHNIPWNDSLGSRYSDWLAIFSLPHVNIIANSQYIYDVYNLTWKKPVGLSEKFSYEELCKII